MIYQDHMSLLLDPENRFIEIQCRTFSYLPYGRIGQLKTWIQQCRQVIYSLPSTNLSPFHQTGRSSMQRCSVQKPKQQKPSRDSWLRSTTIIAIFLTLCTSGCTVTGEVNFSVKNSRDIVVNTLYTKLRPNHMIRMGMLQPNLE